MGLSSGSFKPGVSGNPAGKPKQYAEIVELVRNKSKENIARLVKFAESADDEMVALRATQYLHEIAWGKPKETIDFSGQLNHSADDSVKHLLAAIRNVRGTT